MTGSKSYSMQASGSAGALQTGLAAAQGSEAAAGLPPPMLPGNYEARGSR